MRKSGVSFAYKWLIDWDHNGATIRRRCSPCVSTVPLQISCIVLNAEWMMFKILSPGNTFVINSSLKIWVHFKRNLTTVWSICQRLDSLWLMATPYCYAIVYYVLGVYRGLKPVEKRSGRGAHNWGNITDAVEWVPLCSIVRFVSVTPQCTMQSPLGSPYQLLFDILVRKICIFLFKC